MTTRSVLWGLVLSCVAAAGLGVAAVVLPVHGNPALQHYDSPLFPDVRRGIEGMNGASLVFLALAGFIPAAFGRAHPLLIGVATMALFPFMSFAEMIADPTSHNLWPFEWVLYGVETAPGILGAFLGRRFKRRVWDPGGSTSAPRSERP